MKKFNIKKGENNVLWILFRSGDCCYSIRFGFINIMVDTPVILMSKNLTSSCALKILMKSKEGGKKMFTADAVFCGIALALFVVGVFCWSKGAINAYRKKRK